MFKKTLTCILLASFTQFAIAESLDSALNRSSGNSTRSKVDELFTGDVRLACEAILCLSTGNRPNECQPAIHRYFSIHHRKIGDTIRARHNFLRMCPSSKEQGMPELVNALARGAGRCDAEELNRVMSRKVAVRVCKKIDRHRIYSRHEREQANTEICHNEIKTVILNQKPSYCQAYHNHEWTELNTRYVGKEKEGGRWVD